MKTPSKGWANATDQQMNRAALELIAKVHCVRVTALSRALSGTGINVRKAMFEVIGTNTSRANQAVLDLVLNGNVERFRKFVRQ